MIETHISNNHCVMDIHITRFQSMCWSIKIKINFLKCCRFKFFNSITFLQTEFEDYANIFTLNSSMREFFNHIKEYLFHAIFEGMHDYLIQPYAYGIPRNDFYPLCYPWFPEVVIDEMNPTLFLTKLLVRIEIDTVKGHEQKRVVYVFCTKPSDWDEVFEPFLDSLL